MTKSTTAYFCQPENGRDCFNRTNHPSGKCHLHRDGKGSTGGSSAARIPQQAPISAQSSQRNDEKQDAFHDLIKGSFPDANVAMHYGIINVYKPGRKTFFNRNPKGQKFLVYFGDQGFAVQGDASGSEKADVAEAFGRVYRTEVGNA